MSAALSGTVKASVQAKGAQTTDRATGNGLLIGVVAAVVLLTLLRFALAGVIELLPEEAYYWTYAKHPALGYFDHPPMVAWIIAVGTTLFGDTQLGVRFGTFVLWVASCGLLFLTARLWFGKRAALMATLLFTLVPVYVGVGLIVTPDAPVVFFWLATLYFISRALHTGRGGYWLLAGVTFGGALLSKYYALLLAPSLLLFLVLSPTHRRWLRRPQLWLALPIALLVFSPVIIWNAQHEWASFLFQSTRTVVPQKHTIWDVLHFWLMQVATLSPLFFVLFVCAAARGVRRGWGQRDDRWNFVTSFSLPLFLVFVAASFKTEIHINWTAPAFLSLALGAGAMTMDCLDSINAKRARRWRIGAGVVIALSVAAIILGHTSLAWGKPKVFAYTRAGGWRALAGEVADAREELARQTGQRPFVLGMDKYNIAAELGFYLQQPDECVNMYALGVRALGFRYWTDLHRFEGRPAIAVFGKLRKDLMDELHRHFDDVDEPVEVHLRGHGTRRRVIYLVRCRGYHAEERLPAASQP
jgi:dolichol-phosphate mannosyltransferase